MDSPIPKPGAPRGRSGARKKKKGRLRALPLCVLYVFGVRLAQDNAPVEEGATGEATIVVTAARTILPPNALPLTIDIIDKDALDQQIAIPGRVIDAVANLTPSFSPTRQKLSGSGETLRGRSPLYAINGIPQSTPIRDGSRDGYTIDPFFIDRVELKSYDRRLISTSPAEFWRQVRELAGVERVM